MTALEVFGNRDLTRKVIVQAKHGVGLLRASKNIRNNEECTSRFEKWRAIGCPTDPTLDDMPCLQGAGRICELEFNIQSMGGKIWDGMPAAKAASYVLGKIKTGCVLTFEMGETSVRIHVGEGEENGITVTREGWRKKGIACGPTRDEINDLVHGFMTKTGTVILPCMESTSAGERVDVPRKISLRLEFQSPREDADAKRHKRGGMMTAMRT